MSEETYTPGMVGAKLASVALGIGIMAFGLIWIWHPLTLALGGDKAVAQVVSIEMEKPGQPPVRLTTRKEVDDAADPTRNAVFKYVLRFNVASGETVEAYLNYGQVMRPLHALADEVPIHYNPDDPADLVEAWSPRTYAFGIFFIVIGFITTLSQAIILWHAGKPIRIDPIHSMAAEARHLGEGKRG